MDFSDFPLHLLRLLRQKQAFYLSVALGGILRCPPRVFGTAQTFRCAFIKGGALANLISYLSRNVVFHFCLLLGSECLYRRQPRPFHRQPLVGGKSLYRPYALSDDLEHRVELYCYYLFVYLGRRSPEHPMPEGERGKRLD